MYKQLCNKEDNFKIEEKEEEIKETIVEDNTEKLNQETLKEWFYGE